MIIVNYPAYNVLVTTHELVENPSESKSGEVRPPLHTPQQQCLEAALEALGARRRRRVLFLVVGLGVYGRGFRV